MSPAPVNTCTTPANPTPRRIAWLDCAKGLLIALVVFWHVTWNAAPSVFRTRLCFALGVVILPFFMHAFFAISGYCSDFSQPVFRFLAKKARGILLPALLFEFVFLVAHGPVSTNRIVGILLFKDHWFLFSLFGSMALVRSILILPRRFQLPLVVAAGLTGLFCGIFLPRTNILWIRQSMAFAPFVFAGHWIRKHASDPAAFEAPQKALSAFWLAAVATLLFIGMPAPWFGFAFSLGFRQIPLSLALASGGTAFCLLLAKKGASTRVGRIFERLGKASLGIYLFHFEFIRLFRRHFRDSGTGNFAWYLATTLLVTTVVIGCSFFAWGATGRICRFVQRFRRTSEANPANPSLKTGSGKC